MKFKRLLVLLVCTFCLLPVLTINPAVSAQSTIFTNPDFADTQIASGIFQPTSMEFAPDGRLFILRQNGTIRIYQDGALLPTPFATIPVDNVGERGLLGLAFHPNFASNNYLYLYYTTNTAPVHNRISRFTANGNVVVPNSETIIFEMDNLGTATNHNGGQLAFGLDGMLYAAIGDGAEDPGDAQSLDNLFGKILRLNPNGSIPSNNPFYNSTTGNNRAIWAYGLRNPFAFDIERISGRMFINDVGNTAFEEINQGQAGANYGWPLVEGNQVIGSLPPGYVAPIHTYPIQNEPECAITGAAFYRPTTMQFPSAYNRDYFFADYCSNRIFVRDHNNGTVTEFARNTLSSIVDLEVGPDGALYYLSYSMAAVSRISYQGVNEVPVISTHPQDVTVGYGESAQFTCSATGSQPISYQWRRNTSNISGATSNTYTIPVTSLSDDGAQFRCVATNDNGQATSNPAILTVLEGTPPQPSITITLPDSVSPNLYEAGKIMIFAGDYDDPDAVDANLPDTAFDWRIDFHHGTHTHPFRPSLPGRRSDSVTIADQGHTETNVWYRVYLTVTDSAGLRGSTYVDVYPLVTQLTVNTVPSGLLINLDGQPMLTPITFESVSGAQRIITAPQNQVLVGLHYRFDNWGHGGAASQTIITPATTTTYTANYVFESPANAAPIRNTFNTATPTLTWGSVTWAAGYEVQVSSQSNFRSVGFASGELDAATLAVTTPDLPDAIYYWRVRAKRANGSWGSWSPAETFVVTTN